MPLYMDFHQLENITVDEVVKAHLADISVQDKYKVIYHQFWVNEVAGTVFCLMEGPDKEACETVHQEAHGGVACAITEVEPGFYNLMMGGKQKVDHGHVQNEDGTADTGYRNILVASVDTLIEPGVSANYFTSTITSKGRKLISQKIIDFNGRQLPWETDDCLIGVFNEPLHAIKCAVAIQKSFVDLVADETKLLLRMGLSAAQPVTSKGDFFKDAIKLAHQLSVNTLENKIIVSSLLSKLSKKDIEPPEQIFLTMLTVQEEDFLSKLFFLAEEKLSDPGLTIDSLSNDLCVSRTQLYRKITFLTGHSPNTLMRSLRMNKALNLLKQKSANISQIAYEAGFNTPSYFAKCFLDKFGCTPSEYIKTNKAKAN